MALSSESEIIYDGIAEEYTKSKELPFRVYIEKPTLLKLIGDSITDKRVLDLACGSGYYSRIYRDELKASFVYGVDISQSMIDIAQNLESTSSKSIKYKVLDVGNMSATEPIDGMAQFDVVTAAYLLCYARTTSELLKFCQVIARNLKDGGKFISLNDNPLDDLRKYKETRSQMEKYAIIKSMLNGNTQPTEGDLIQYEIINTDRSVATFSIAWWPLSTYEWALRTAGFTNWRWVEMELDTSSGQDPNYWSSFLTNCPLIALEATK